MRNILLCSSIFSLGRYKLFLFFFGKNEIPKDFDDGRYTMGRTVYKYGFVLFIKLYFIFPVKKTEKL